VILSDVVRSDFVGTTNNTLSISSFLYFWQGDRSPVEEAFAMNYIAKFLMFVLSATVVYCGGGGSGTGTMSFGPWVLLAVV
jgi:hypothetical protein